MSLPATFFYVISGLLLVFGSLRLFHLGLRRPRIEDAETPASRRRRRQNIVGGTAWIISGLFLLLWTAGVIRLPSRPPPEAEGSPPPTQG